MDCIANRWTFSVGDPTWAGWLATILYFAAAAAVWYRASNLGRPVNKHDMVAGADSNFAIVWRAGAILLLALAANKQLDLQSLVTGVGRCMALSQGWFWARDGVQVGFAAIVAFGVVGAGIFIARRFRGELEDAKLAVLGFILLAFFVLLRTFSFHGATALFDIRIGVISLNWMLETSALGLIIIGALQHKQWNKWKTSDHD